MRSDGKTIVDLDCFEARQLLMKQESFCTVNLPSYVDFSGVLQKQKSAALVMRVKRFSKQIFLLERMRVPSKSYTMARIT